MDAPKSVTDYIPWVAAVGLLIERLVKLWRETQRDHHDREAGDAENLFARAMKFIDDLTAQLAACRAENDQLRQDHAATRVRLAEAEAQIVVLRRAIEQKGVG